jgi:hypothetical protein
LAKKNGGECFFKEYRKTTDRIKWKCFIGHEWEAAVSEVQRGSWCPQCARNNGRTNSIETCRNIASKNFGECLSNDYCNGKQRLIWRCHQGHIWKASLGNIKDNDSWCPHCSQSTGESLFRSRIELVLGKPFVKRRPSWLLSDKGYRLELDGYNEELKMAFEFQGRQHFEYIQHWHKTKENFDTQVFKDKKKIDVLRSKGIKLFLPTYLLKYDDYDNFIRSCMNET